MLKMFWRLNKLVLLFCLINNCLCYAADVRIIDEISAYNEKKYSEVIELGKRLVKVNFTNDTAHYFMANAYSQLKREQEAIQEYEICLVQSKNPQILAYSKEALAVLKKDASNFIEAHNTDELKEEFSKQEQVKLKQIHDDEQMKIKQINADAEAEIALVSKHWLMPDDTLLYNVKEQAKVDGIKEAAREKVDGITEIATRQRHEIVDFYKLKIDSLNTSVIHINSARKPGASYVQLMPSRTSLYVRNYVTYAEELPVPPVVQELRAVQQTLILGPTRSPSKKMQ